MPDALVGAHGHLHSARDGHAINVASVVVWSKRFLVVVAACAAPVPSPAAAPVHAPPPRAAGDVADDCGEGRVTGDEVCGPNVVRNAACPDGWGICWACTPSCHAWTEISVSRERSYDDRCLADVMRRMPRRGFVERNPRRDVPPEARIELDPRQAHMTDRDRNRYDRADWNVR
jgi:hypothetical protein